jgi:hypothetical protein
MTDLGNALFIYNMTSPTFTETQKYTAITNCTSILYSGSGLAYGEVSILGSNATGTQTQCNSYDLVCTGNNIINTLKTGFAALIAAFIPSTTPTDGYNKQIYQLLEDYSLSQWGDKNICQLEVSNQTDFAALELNRHTFVTEYTYDEYLTPGSYYWRVRCKRGQEWGMWSDKGNFTHINNSVFFDWTIN